VSWADNVSQEESSACLRNAAEHGSRHGSNNAIFALSLQAGTTDTLIDLAQNNSDRDIRGKALFWLSQQAGRKAADALKDAAENDPEESVRSKASGRKRSSLATPERSVDSDARRSDEERCREAAAYRRHQSSTASENRTATQRRCTSGCSRA